MRAFFIQVGDHDFLGKVVLSGASLAKPKTGAVWYPLQRDNGSSRAAGPRSHAFVKVRRLGNWCFRALIYDVKK